MTVFKPEDLFQRLHAGRVLVTGNSRLARVLTARYGEWQMRCPSLQNYLDLLPLNSKFKADQKHSVYPFPVWF